MPSSFDGPNKIITLPSGGSVIDVSVADLYSEWKQWVTEGNNSKYLPAFRTIGGDPLSLIINAGAYFFLRNDLGWRIKPAEQDGTWNVSGNLAMEDPLTQGINPTDGAYTAAIIGLQPVTQGVDDSLRVTLEYMQFEGGVTVDMVDGYSGTGHIGKNPIGTPKFPSNNLADALQIIDNNSLPKVIYFVGDALVDNGGDYRGYTFIGSGKTKSNIEISAASQVEGCEFYDAHIFGTLDGNAKLRNCKISNLNYIHGVVEQCVLSGGTISLGGASPAIFVDCVSGDEWPIIDAGALSADLIMQNYNGHLYLVNKPGPDLAEINMNSGHLIMDATVTGGTIEVYGMGKLEDNSNGAVVLRSHFFEPQVTQEIHDAHFNKRVWDRDGNSIVIYDTDGVTPLYIFEATDAGNVTTIDPV